jgi:hypothetical protein
VKLDEVLRAQANSLRRAGGQGADPDGAPLVEAEQRNPGARRRDGLGHRQAHRQRARVAVASGVPGFAPHEHGERVEEVLDVIARGAGEKCFSTYWEVDWGLRWNPAREVWVDGDGHRYDGSRFGVGSRTNERAKPGGARGEGR